MLGLNHSNYTIRLAQECVIRTIHEMNMNHASKDIMDHLRGLAAMSDAELDALKGEYNGSLKEVEENISKIFAYKYADKKELVISIIRAGYVDNKQEFRRLVAEL